MSYPTSVWMETTNICNYRCMFCPRELIKKTQKIMSLEEFKVIADKLKEAGITIGCMSGYGEPLLDPTLYDKYKYGREIGVFRGIVGINTNGSLLTRDKWDTILENSDFLTISCVNTHDDYRLLTGYSWTIFYKKVTEFIIERNIKKPEFVINIGCNKVEGHDLDKVNKAFRGYNVNIIGDPGIKWTNSIKGPTYCDMEDGHMTILVDGTCTNCCFDFNGENSFGNILTDSVEQIKENFTKKKDFPLCKRCDYVG